MRHPQTRRWLTIRLFALIALYFTIDVVAWLRSDAAEKIGGQDWDAQLFYLAAPKISLLEYGELPLWNPWYVGGLPVLENPQSKFFSPTFFLSLFWSAPVAAKLAILVYYLVGFAGCYFLFVRGLRLRVAPALLGTGMFMYSSYLPLHLYAGHITFVSCTFLPWLVYCALRAYQSRRWAWSVGVGLILSQMYAEGYHIPLFIIPAGIVLAVLYSVSLRTMYPARIAGIALASFIVFSVYRLYPQFDYMLFGPGAQRFVDDSALSPRALWEIFTLPTDNPFAIRNPEQKHFWWELGAYVGVLPIYVTVMVMPFLRRRDWPVLVVFVGTLLVMAGHFAEFAPVKIFQYVPLYSHARCFGRFGIVGVFLFGLLAALWTQRALKFFDDRERPRRFATIAHVALWLLTLAALHDMRKQNTPIFRKTFEITLPRSVSAQVRPRTIARLDPALQRGTNSVMYPALLANLSTRDGYEILNGNRTLPAYGEPEYVGEVWFESNAQESVQTRKLVFEQWSPHRVEVSFSTGTPGRLVVNQNYNRGWQAAPPYKLIEYPESPEGFVREPLSVAVPAGSHRVVLTYHRPWLRLFVWVCFALQLLAGLWCCFQIIRASLARRDHGTELE